MRRSGRRYPLLIYRRMLDRWWPVTLIMGLALLAVWWPVSRPGIWQVELWRSTFLLLLAISILLVSGIVFLTGRLAYVQPFGDHLLVVTPFLRMKISYKRFQRTSSAAMHALFPPGRLSNWQHEILEPLAGKTAIVIELNALPIPRSALKMYLSPYFFKDQTPHIVILVRDWMGFSTELESMRTTGGVVKPKARQPASILSRLPKRDT